MQDLAFLNAHEQEMSVSLISMMAKSAGRLHRCWKMFLFNAVHNGDLSSLCGLQGHWSLRMWSFPFPSQEKDIEKTSHHMRVDNLHPPPPLPPNCREPPYFPVNVRYLSPEWPPPSTSQLQLQDFKIKAPKTRPQKSLQLAYMYEHVE